MSELNRQQFAVSDIEAGYFGELECKCALKHFGSAAVV